MALADSTITVDVHDTLPDVLGRLQTLSGQAVRLRVPTGSAILLTANEFRVLKDAAERERVRLTLESPDRLRLQLARMFNLPAAFPDPAVVTPIRPDVGQSPPRPSAPSVREMAARGDTSRAPATPSPTTPSSLPPTRVSHPQRQESRPAAKHYTPTSAARSATRSPQQEDERPARESGHNRAAPAQESSSPTVSSPAATSESDAAKTGAANKSEPASENGITDGAAAAKPGHAAELVGGDVPKEVLLLAASDAVPEHRAKRRRIKPPPASTSSNHVGTIDVDDLSERDNHWTMPQAPRRFGQRAAIGAGAVVILVVALILAAVFALPGVSIAVTLKQQPVQGELTYRVVTGQTANGQANGHDLVFPATPFAFDVTVTKQIPTTGTRLIPQDTATGAVEFANPTTQAVKLAKGTRLTAETGTQFELTDDVTVPAADAKSGHSGFASGKVRAVDPGSKGNVDTGVLGGHLDAGIYYSNRNGPTVGGTDKKVPAVSAADLKTLQSQVDSDLPQTARKAVDSKLPTGQSFVASSLTLGEPTYSFDHKEGDDATELSLTATVRVNGLSYDQAAAMDQVKATMHQQLAAGLPADYTLDPASLQLSQPVETAHDASGSRFKVTASGHAHANFSASARHDLAGQLSGKSADEAAKILAANPALAGAKISYSPSWLPKRMPRLASRINIHVAS